jgi:hypothetical protein
MSLHIARFIDKIKAAESKNRKDITMSVRDAKDLHGDITKLLLAVHELRNVQKESGDTTSVEVSGGDW